MWLVVIMQNRESLSFPGSLQQSTTSGERIFIPRAEGSTKSQRRMIVGSLTVIVRRNETPHIPVV
jgi:hypothetical protein